MSVLVKNPLTEATTHLKNTILSGREITNYLYQGISHCFPGSSLSLTFFPSPFFKTLTTVNAENNWNLPEKEKVWFSKQLKNNQFKISKSGVGHLYILNREKTNFTDKNQLKRDQKAYQNNCSDLLYLVLNSEEDGFLGLITIHSWNQNTTLKKKYPHFNQALTQAKQLCEHGILAFENLSMHLKIENLVSNKHLLQEKIQKDEKSLKHHVKELTALYEISNTLSHSLSYYQLVKLIFESIEKVLPFDLGLIFLLDFGKSGEIITRVNTPIETKFIQTMQTNIVKSTKTFIQNKPLPEKIHISTEKYYKSPISSKKQTLTSFSNIPLIFKEELLGMITLCNDEKIPLSKENLTFLHTIANQLSSHLGRLKLVKSLEKSKIESLIQSMAEGILMLDSKQEIEVINPIAIKILNLPSEENITFEMIEAQLNEMKILHLYKKTLKEKKPILNYEIRYNSSVLLANINPVFDTEKRQIGTVMVFRDFTEFHKINRIKSQRLEIMSQVNMIIRSITDLDNLLPVVMDFILNVTHTDMGSILLKQESEYVTKVHSNFPEKVNRFYQFKNGESISNHVIQNRQVVFIEDYLNNPNIKPNPKVSIDFYLCIPILIKDELIGIINIVQKYRKTEYTLTHDDIKTLEVITTLIGTAIHNALLYKKTIEKQKMDQELKIANEIQMKLLPQTLPDIPDIDLGAISVPAREIGGDYYDFFELENGQIGFLIADIVGKGVPAGLFMAMLKSVLHAHLPTFSSPKKAMDRINALLYKDPVMKKFVPLFYGVLDPNTYKFRFCNAGHEPPLWLSKNNFTLLDTPGIPLGGLEKSSYKEKSISLKPNDIITLFTDGIIESRNSHGKDLGHTLVKHWIKKHQEQSAQEIVKTIHSNIIQYTRDSHQHDDLTLVVLKLCQFDTHDKPLKTQKIAVNSSKCHIRTVREIAYTMAKEMGFTSETATDIKLAVNEAHSNVIEHTYHNQDNGEIAFRFIRYKNRLEIKIKDFAPGVDQRTIKKKEDLDSLEGSGFGVFLIHSIMDEVHYDRNQRVGTVLHLTKYLRPENSEMKSEHTVKKEKQKGEK